MLVDVVGAYSKTERYIEENKKSLSIITGAIILIVGGYFGYKKLYVEPMETEAQSQMFMAERYFERDSLELAINGDGQWLGFLDIVDEYSITPSGNLANYYLGICYLKKGQYQDAIDYLSAFDCDDEMASSVAIGAIGDAYMQLGETKTAVTYYIDAAKEQKNDFTSPIYLMKAAQALEGLGDFKKAIGVYEDIRKNYPETKEGLEVEKYLERASTLSVNK